uniref:Uncharacterized protein n=1 Tax=Rangifer tarandus platyrhynchus TaxID=3082113 RepID=A0ACB0EAM9_RANTA|nr:unnamed protein product [Rangifer tarandus platyrhynchus]
MLMGDCLEEEVEKKGSQKVESMEKCGGMRLRTWPPEGAWENEVRSQPSAQNLPVAPASFLRVKVFSVEL